tara:strand:+ start:186 stop:467 length:282 start_codon:yes stop_codon:yes gene_type:complete
MTRGNLERKNLENIILRRLRKLSTEEENKREKQKLSKLRSDFLEQKSLFTYAELSGLEQEKKNMKVFLNYLNTWIIKLNNKNNKNNKTVKYKK